MLRKGTAHIIVVVAVSLVLLAPGPAHSAPKYERSSVSYLRDVFYIGTDSRLSPEEEEYFLDAVQERVSLARFDANPLPEQLTRAFAERAGSKKLASADELEPLLMDTIGGEIIRILDAAKEIRAQDHLTEADRHSFVTTKAKALGITADDLERVMNSAHVFIPIVMKCDFTKDNDRYSVDLVAGVSCYNLEIDDDGSSLVFSRYVTATPSERKPGTYEPASDTKRLEAFKNAVKDFGQNLELNLREVSDFCLHGTISRVKGGTVWFKLGSKEGVSLDERYRVVEYVEDSQGQIAEREMGYLRVVSVGDNNTDPAVLSRGKSFLGGGFEKGMTLREYPQSLHQYYFALDAVPIKLGTGYIQADGIKYLEILSDRTTYAPVLVIGAMRDLAGDIGLSEAFFTGDFQIGLGKPDAQVYDRYYSTNLGFVLGLHVGILKKFYSGPVALYGGARYGWQALYVGVNVDSTNTSLLEPDYGFSASGWGFSCVGGLEITLDIRQSIGAGVKYMAFKPIDDWGLSLKGNKKDWDSLDPPELEFKGLGLSLFYSRHF